MIQLTKIQNPESCLLTAINNYCNTLNETTCYGYTGLPNESGVTSLCTWDSSLNKCVIDQDISDWNCIQGFIKGDPFSCNTKEDIRLRIYEKCEKVLDC